MIKLFVTDLDGTLKVIREELRVDDRELKAWHQLGENKKIRVLATGRNLKLVSKTLRDNAPFDYIIFSSGAGIIDWNEKKIIKQKTFKFFQIKSLCKYLLKLNLPFFLFHNIPDNHNSYISPVLFDQKDTFFGEKIFYKEHSDLMPDVEEIDLNREFTQLIVTTLSINSLDLDSLKNDIMDFGNFSLIDVMSIFQKESRMVEIFPVGINKGSALNHISEMEKILPSESIVFGNDYNDIEMLDWSPNSYITKGSPDSLKKYATEIGYSNECTVASMINSIIESNFDI